MGIGIYIGNTVGQSKRSYWTQAKIAATFLFWGETSKITGGKLYNQVSGRTSEYLTVAGSPATFQAPNTADYKTADTDKIWFKYAANVQRTATTAELIGYDFARTIIKYDNTSPYAIRIIAILKSGVVLTTSESNHLRDYFDLSLWWDNTLILHGNLKGNRGTGQNVFTKEVSTLAISLNNYYKFDEASGNLIDIVNANNGVVTNATREQVGKIDKAYSFAANGNIILNTAITFLTTNSLTVSLWIKCAAIDTAEYLIGNRDAGTSLIQLYKTNANLTFRANSTGDASVTWQNILTAGDWILVAGKRDVVTDKINVGVNGVWYNTPVTDATTANIAGNRIKLAMAQNGTLGFTGSICQFIIWKGKALSDAEFMDLYNNNNGVPYPLI